MLNATSRRLAILPRLRFGRRSVRALPHPEKLHRGGEDAFISDDFIISVADGVGGYASSGVNPAVFTRRVMHHTLRSARTNVGSTSSKVALSAGLKSTLAERVVGGCPATVASILGDGSDKTVVDILNLGDCGTILFRKDFALYKTTVQQHYFNCPFQLPDDTPSKGISASVTLEPGDVILQASDGVFDNVFEDQILELMQRVYRNERSSNDAAEELATLATRLGADKTYKSPFALSAMALGHRFIGGKQDDVTVLFSIIEETPAEHKFSEPSKTSPMLITDVFCE